MMLLMSMQENSTPVKPELLGLIGKDTLRRRFAQAGCRMASFEYRKRVGTEDGIPWSIEVAFGWCPGKPRQFITGVNWSPGIYNPFRLSEWTLQDARLSEDAPVILVIHFTSPLVSYTDRGKSSLTLTRDQQLALNESVTLAAKRWTKQRKKEERDASAEERREIAMDRTVRTKLTEAVNAVVVKAYELASTNGTLPANARQVMYVVRRLIEKYTTETLAASYFTQKLLPDYVKANNLNWNVVYDARGHFREPHTEIEFGVGHVEVREYILKVNKFKVVPDTFEVRKTLFPTLGPEHRYGAVLHCEKEGFDELFEQVKLAEKWDIAITSTKGISVTASRELAQALCSKYGIPLIVIHDFDISGFTIKHTLKHSTRRFTFDKEFEVIDLGMRWEDIRGLGTETFRPQEVQCR